MVRLGQQEERLAFLWANITSGKLLPSGESADKRSYESDPPITWMEEICAVPASRLIIAKPLPLSGNPENTAKSPLINLHLFFLTVTSVTATCRFSNPNKCVLLDEPLPAVLSLDWDRNIFFLLVTHVVVFMPEAPQPSFNMKCNGGNDVPAMLLFWTAYI